MSETILNKSIYLNDNLIKNDDGLVRYEGNESIEPLTSNTFTSNSNTYNTSQTATVENKKPHTTTVSSVLINTSNQIKQNSSSEKTSSLDLTSLNQFLVNSNSVVANNLTSQSVPAAPHNAAFDLIGLTALRNDPQFAGLDGGGFSVAIIDTGLDSSHPDLSPHYMTGYDFINNVTVSKGQSDDGQGHGTHVSGTVGATDPNIGVATGVGLIGLRVLDDQGSGSSQNIERALQWVLNNYKTYNIAAINMSLGGGQSYTNKSQDTGGLDVQINQDIQNLQNVGVSVVSAAGNSYYANQQIPGVSSPGILSTINVGAVWGADYNAYLTDAYAPYNNLDPNGITFGDNSSEYNTTKQDTITVFSQRLSNPGQLEDTLFAPGSEILSTYPGGGLHQEQGTSQASPHIAGAVAILQEAAVKFGGRTLTPLEVNNILHSTGDVVADVNRGNNNNTTFTGANYRRLNIYNAVKAVKQMFQPSGGGGGGGSTDSNGTIAGSINIPTLDGTNYLQTIDGSIGIDGTNTSIGNTDVDIYHFKSAVTGQVNIDLGGDPNHPQNFNNLLRLFDGSGNQLSSNAGGQSSSLQVSVTAGVDYYIGVSGKTNSGYNPKVAGSGSAGETGNYELKLSLNTTTDINGILGGAVPITLGTERDPSIQKQGFIGYDYGTYVGTADVDLFKVVIPDNGVLNINVDTPFTSGYVDSYLRIFNPDGSQAYFTDTGAAIVNDDRYLTSNEYSDPSTGAIYNSTSGAFIGHTTDSFIAGTVNRGETYYIGVSDVANDNYSTTNTNNRSASGTGGSYNLSVSFHNNDRNGSIGRAISNLSLPIIQQHGYIGQDGDPTTGQLLDVGNLDVDFFKLTSPTAGILQTVINSEQKTNYSDPVNTLITIFDAQGNRLATSIQQKGIDPLLSYTIQANTNYYVAVSGYGNNNFDPFLAGSGTPGETGEYLFSASILPSTNVASLSDNARGDSLIKTISSGSSIAGNIGRDDTFYIGPSDIDLYRFVANSNGRISINTLGNGQNPASTFLRLFDANWNEIAYDQNQGNLNGNSSLQVQVTAGNTYYIGVNGAGPQERSYNPTVNQDTILASSTSLGDYTLSILDIIDPARYAASYPDLIKAFGYNLPALATHYSTIGKAEGRNPNLFDPYLYIASNPDLITTVKTDVNAAEKHYITNGYNEKRPTTTFNPSEYEASNPDLIPALGNNPTQSTQHYITNGYNEKRPTTTFNPSKYEASNPDLIAAFGNNPSQVTQHYITSGYNEKRPTTTFNAARYIASYGDLINAFHYNLDAATQQYLSFGYSEKRNPNVFDPTAYLNKYADLRATLGNNLDAATQHYIEHGYAEHRTWM